MPRLPITIPALFLVAAGITHPLSASAQTSASITALPTACAALRQLRLPDVRFTDVADAPDALANSDSVRSPHCRVAGVIGREIAFLVMLPHSWSGRLLMGGNGGFAGSIERAVFRETEKGYVTVATNTGHDADGIRARWALDQPERQVNYGSLAVHRTIEVAKAIARAFYGSDPRFAYFFGCSNGGRQALVEVQRYPEDFDGVVAGAPAAHFSIFLGAFLKNVLAAIPTPAYYAHPIITRANLDLLGAKVLEACDALDGVRDGILTDPRDCKFSLASIRGCAGDRPAPDCLTSAQRAAIARIYAPATDERGRVAYAGQPFGGENLPFGWSTWIVGNDSAFLRASHLPSLQAAFLIEGAKYFIFSDSAWDYSSYRGTLFPETRRMAALADATDPNLQPFAAHHGKLLIYHGWNDPALNPLETIDYYEKVLAHDPTARDYVRLFMLPGVLHCGGGSGPSDVDWMALITDWVEHDRAPEQPIATKRGKGGTALMTRPLCVYPKRAAYVGSGSTDDAKNFVCRDP